MIDEMLLESTVVRRCILGGDCVFRGFRLRGAMAARPACGAGLARVHSVVDGIREWPELECIQQKHNQRALWESIRL